MQTRFQRFSILTGCILLGVLLVLNAYVTWRQLNAQVELGRWVLHTQQVRLELAQTQELLVDAETGQRGFLLTGDARYLDPFDWASNQVGQHIDHLAELTADNPVQQRHVAELRPLAQEKLDELNGTIVLFRSGHPDDAKALVLTSRGLLAMDGLRQILAEMRDEETRLDAERSDAYRRDVRATAASIWLATLIAMMGLAGFSWLVFRSIRRRERYARELSEREERFRITLSSIGDAVIATDRFGAITFLNPVAETLTGWGLRDVRGKDITEVFPIFNELSGMPVEDPVGKVVQAGVVVGLANHTVLRSKDGRLIPIEDSAAPICDDRGELIGVVLVFRDVTAERNSEEVLRRAEKLAAAARLSATMAHEINNPLAAIMNLIFLARSAPDAPEASIQQLTQAELELERVAHITRQTLGFYRESGTTEPVDIQLLVESVLKLYENRLSGKRIDVKRAFDGACPPVDGVLGELRQAVSNLVANAIDAVEAGGTITVGVRATYGNDAAIEIVVADNGPGIAKDHIHRIFEPFFTTKKDVGTGLGLWSAKSIVERHGGNITVSPNDNDSLGRGAVFTVRLPCTARATPLEVK